MQTSSAELWKTMHEAERLALHAALYTWPAAQIAPGWVLDLGCECGFGGVLIAASNPSLQVAGMDLDAAGLRYAQTLHGKGGAAEVRGEGRHLPFAPECFTAIYLVHVLHLVDRPDQVLREAHRALKPGGIAVIAVPRSEPPVGGDPADQHAGFLRAGLDRLFAEVYCPDEISGRLPSLPSRVFRLDAKASAWLALCWK